ncbi:MULTISPECIES: GntR family transcriptional regulator [unclassified Pseudonocardia]|uniref:GntR family transcriptional regulator n=1 Tax=unclassified Pseudonocardia TaxID=2619320 RepID=UPI001481FB9C|nr:GntR family transcriptional regulator [Pseudonocardia sp. Ae707_Ps1]
MPVPSPIPQVRAADARRVRDLLRIAVAGRPRAAGLLPREDELMVAFGVSRSVVRAALALLSDEGLLRPGPAAHRIVATPDYRGGHDVVTDPYRPPRWLGRAGITAPDVLAGWLGVPPGSPVLRTECVAGTAGGGTVLETHYVATPAAAELLAVPDTGPFDRLLADACLDPGVVRTRSGPVPADPDTAGLLGVAPATPLLGIERTVAAPGGGVLAAGVLRAHAGPVPHAARTAGDGRPEGALPAPVAAVW